MNRIDTSFITDPNVGQPFTGPSLAFLQSATTEIVGATVQTLIGDVPSTTTPYILYGCLETSLGGGNYSYTKGHIFMNNEVYNFPAISSIAISATPICTITTTNDPIADPLEFSDEVFRNVHNHNTIVLSDGASGSGTFDFSGAVSLRNFVPKRYEANYLYTASTLSTGNTNSLTVYAVTAPCDMEANSFKIVWCVSYVTPVSTLDSGQIDWGIKINGSNKATCGAAIPASWCGGLSIRQTYQLIVPVTVTKGDKIELFYNCTSLGTDPFVGMSGLILEASSNKTSNW